MRIRFLPIAALVAAGCAGWGLSRSESAPSPTSETSVPEAPLERRVAALFYSDLGPDTVDVSRYPAQQQRNYEAYARVCSSCHTLARSINAPWVNRRWWDFYVSQMWVRARIQREKLSDDEINATLDFLEYDSHLRKVEHAAEFERLRLVLKRRFEKALDERVETLQKQPQPRLLTP